MRRAIAVLRTGINGFNSPPSIKAHTAGSYLLQQRYASSQAAQVCWNCQKQGRHMICADCGCLQDVDNSIVRKYKALCPAIVNAFFSFLELLWLARLPHKLLAAVAGANPALSSAAGARAPWQVQQQVSNSATKWQHVLIQVPFRTSREQTNSADWSSLINKAYKTLATPVERGQYMLQLEGEQMPQDNSALNTQFLMAMMERNEEVEEAEDSAALDALYTQLTKELEEKAHKLTAHFEAKDLPAVKATLVEMKYLLSIQSSIKKKQQLLMEAASTWSGIQNRLFDRAIDRFGDFGHCCRTIRNSWSMNTKNVIKDDRCDYCTCPKTKTNKSKTVMKRWPNKFLLVHFKRGLRYFHAYAWAADR